MGPTYRAVAWGNQAMGRTAGEALDALTSRLADQDALEGLIDAELRAATERAAAIGRDLAP